MNPPIASSFLFKYPGDATCLFLFHQEPGVDRLQYTYADINSKSVGIFFIFNAGFQAVLGNPVSKLRLRISGTASSACGLRSQAQLGNKRGITRSASHRAGSQGPPWEPAAYGHIRNSLISQQISKTCLAAENHLK